jgi:hypothetical protein
MTTCGLVFSVKKKSGGVKLDGSGNFAYLHMNSYSLYTFFCILDAMHQGSMFCIQSRYPLPLGKLWRLFPTGTEYQFLG